MGNGESKTTTYDSSDPNKFKCNKLLLNAYPSKNITLNILENKPLKFSTKDLLFALNNLSFTLSYKLSAQHYRNKKSFTIFKELANNPLLGNLLKYVKDVENYKSELKENKTSDFIDKTKRFLSENFNSTKLI